MTEQTFEIEQDANGELVAVDTKQDAIENRRSQVWDLYMRGMKVNVIASVLSVHRNTVSNDLRELKKKLGDDVAKMDPAESVGETLKHYDEIWRSAVLEFNAAQTTGAKNNFLRTALEAIRQKAALLSSCGVIPTVNNGGVNVQVNVANISNMQKQMSGMSMDELEEKKLKLLKRIESLPMPSGA